MLLQKSIHPLTDYLNYLESIEVKIDVTRLRLVEQAYRIAADVAPILLRTEIVLVGGWLRSIVSYGQIAIGDIKALASTALEVHKALGAELEAIEVVRALAEKENPPGPAQASSVVEVDILARLRKLLQHAQAGRAEPGSNAFATPYFDLIVGEVQDALDMIRQYGLPARDPRPHFTQHTASGSNARILAGLKRLMGRAKDGIGDSNESSEARGHFLAMVEEIRLLIDKVDIYGLPDKPGHPADQDEIDVPARLRTVRAVAQQGVDKSASGSDDRGRYVHIVSQMDDLIRSLNDH